MKETSPKLNNGTIVDNYDDFKIEFDPISDALAAIRNGECIIVVDDERRENEGDLIVLLSLQLLNKLILWLQREEDLYV